MGLAELRELNIRETREKLDSLSDEVKLFRLLHLHDEIVKSIGRLARSEAVDKTDDVLSEALDSMEKLKAKYEQEISALCSNAAPRTAKLLGHILAAKVLYLAGGLRKLASMPSSKIQVLGAEKAFFKHLKKDSRPPKQGIIFQHIKVKESENKGKAARQLASEIMKTARIDFFRK